MTDAEIGTVPVTVVERRRGWHLASWKELWRYRELAYFLCWRDLKVRYKQTVLGVLWAFLQPFVKMIVFSVIFGSLAGMDSEGFPYAVFVFSALLPWQFFSDCLTRSGQSVVNNSHLMTKVYFPRLAMPIGAAMASLVDFAISFFILIGLMLYYRIVPTASFAMVAPLTIFTVLAAFSVGTLLSTLEVAYRDFRHMMPFLVQTWMFLTPVIYPVRIIPERWRWLMALNPMGGIVDGWRSAVLGKPFAWGELGLSLAVTGVLLLAGLVCFRKLEGRFADIV